MHVFKEDKRNGGAVLVACVRLTFYQEFRFFLLSHLILVNDQAFHLFRRLRDSVAKWKRRKRM